MALCFSCGEIKHGAFCPCPKCRVESSGDSGLDITFSDHNLDLETLKEFGNVIRAIHKCSTDPGTRFWAFLHFISEHHSDILRVELHPEMKVKVMDALRGVTLPSVTLRLSPMRRHSAREPDDDA